MKIRFYDHKGFDETRVIFAVIAARYRGQWVYCIHRNRDTYEIPGGHREEGEAPMDTARRELFEETGAKEYDLFPICIYSVQRELDEPERSGLLCYAEIREMGELPPSEIERVELFDHHPQDWTYPEIQPHLLRRVEEWLLEREG